jgi:uncharacterized protein (DUF1501 family)
MKLTRRDLLKAGAVGATAYFLPDRLLEKAMAAPVPEKVVVAIYLRGGADPLSLVVPAFDDTYYDVRPDVQIAPGAELTLSGGNPHGFGLYPLLTDMQAMYDDGEMSIVHLSGSPSDSRSHFDAQDYMEKAAPDDKGVTSGWLNRYLVSIGNGASISGVSLSKTPQLALLGSSPNVAFNSIARFGVSGDFANERQIALAGYYAAEEPSTLSDGVNSAFSAVDLIAGVDTSTSVTYPAGNKLADALKDVAAIIKAQVGAKVFAVELGGWDHHSNQLSELVVKGGELNGALKAFRDDLENAGGTNYLDHTMTLCMTEFGRRVQQNGGAGSDHGHGGVMFAVGGSHAGGRVILADDDWPGLEPPALFKGEDLQVTTDFRDIFAEVLNRHLGASVASLAPVFPDFSVKESSFPGLFT